jgi:membrane protease YdiL (CAAX protease family)
MACLFTFAHDQYLIPNAYSVATIVSLLIMGIGYGVVFAWARSLVPSIVAHAIINVPNDAAVAGRTPDGIRVLRSGNGTTWSCRPQAGFLECHSGRVRRSPSWERHSDRVGTS